MRPRMQHRMQRWALPGGEQEAAARAVTTLQNLGPLVPPRVWAAVLRALWNGWVTARRWPEGPMAGQTCIFGCQGQEDSIEHYACCPIVAGFAWRRLGLRTVPGASATARLAEFLLLDVDPAQRPPVELTLSALRLAAVYKTHNWWRHASRRTPLMAQQALQQVVVDLVAGHGRATQILDAAVRPAAP